MKFIKNLLQMFAENINLTSNEEISTETAHSFWETALIYLARPQLVHDQCAQLTKIPDGNSKTVEFNVVQNFGTDIDENSLAEGALKYGAGAKAGQNKPGQKLAITPIPVMVAQYGNYTEISDMLQITAKHGIFRIATEELSAQAAGVGDKITRNKMHECTGSFVAGGVSELSGLTSTTYLTVDDIFKGAARLKGANAPTFSDGSYRAIVHPYVAKDIMSKLDGITAWTDVKKYANPEDILNGELGKIGQVRLMETTNAKYYKKGELAGAPSDVPVFATIICGNNAVGTTELSGMGLKMIIKSPEQIGGALDQFGTAGWKMTKAAEILQDKYITKVYSASSLGGLIEESN